MEIEKDKKIAVLFGVENPVGKECLELLLHHEAYTSVIVFTGASLHRTHPRLQYRSIAAVKNNSLPAISGQDLFFCTNGYFQSFTEASDEASAPLSLVIPVAKKAIAGGINQFLVLSSGDADPDALLPLARMRGQMALVLRQMPFWAVRIFESAPIMKKSLYNDAGERLGAFLRRNVEELTGTWLSNQVPVEAATVAAAMVAAAQHIQQGYFVYDTRRMEKLAGEK